MSSIFFNNKKLSSVNRTIIISLISFCVLVTGLGLGLNLYQTKKSFAAGVNTVDIILGQKTVGNTVVASVCLLADSSINLGDAGVWLKYDNTKVTPNSTLTAKGVYDGPADLSGNYAPMTWNLVSGRTDTHSMKAIFNSNPATPIPNSTAINNNTPGLFGTATFNIGAGAGSNNIIIDNTGTAVLKTPTNTPLTFSVINFAGDCTAYTAGSGTVVTPTLGTASTTPIVGTVGSSLPTITLISSNLAANTPATFTPAGGTAIAGFITNGVFTPTDPATISSGSLTGGRNGVLAVTTPTGITALNIPTNFSSSAVGNSQLSTNGGGIITINNNSSSSDSTKSSSANNSSVKPLPKNETEADGIELPDTVSLPKTGGLKNTGDAQVVSENLPRTGGNQFVIAVLSLIVLISVALIYISLQKKKQLKFDQNNEIKK
jgi:hypothetical protein